MPHALLLALFVWLGLCIGAIAEEEHDHSKLGDVGKFYSTWMRPKGNFSGISHRAASCCNKTDCFAVAETRMENGRYLVRPEGYFTWFKVDPAIIESNQSDPGESPDGRSHVCIIGGQAVCFQEGGGT